MRNGHIFRYVKRALRAGLISVFGFYSILAGAPEQGLQVRMTWGEDAKEAAAYSVKLVPETTNLQISDVKPISLDPGEALNNSVVDSRAGGGDVDGLQFTLSTSIVPPDIQRKIHIIWADLISQSDPDTARRLSTDASIHPNSPRLTVLLNREGTRGFTVSMDQLQREKAIWIPSLHVFLSVGDAPVSFREHQRDIAPFKGARILEQIEWESEATLSQYKARWEDMGHPSYVNPQPHGPGHIVCLTWDSAIAKFGIDRGAGVWNDYGNPDHFQFWFSFGDLTQGVSRTWKSQKLQDGFPIITTTFEEDGLRYEVEQFAYPLDGPPKQRRGDLNMVLLQQVRVTELNGKARKVPVSFSHRRQLPSFIDSAITAERDGDAVLFRDRAYQRVLFSISGFGGGNVESSLVDDYQNEMKRVNATVSLNIPAKGTAQFIAKLASPLVNSADVQKLQAIDYQAARSQTVEFWSNYVQQGARFQVPETEVNELFKANLWHALRLPRRHGSNEENVAIDLPYSNFAYSQTGTPWPVNQAVYVDYMLYNLRGYHAISTEELIAQYRNNEEQNGHINGFANWGVYTPSMLYSVAQNYLLSRDRAALDRMLPASMKALDYCLEQLRLAQTHEGSAKGLMSGPLNDVTGEGVWAFNQAYMYAGLNLFGQVLQEIEDPRAEACKQAALDLKRAAEQSFLIASVRSPIVQLRDHTWQPYVPCNATTLRRLMDQWYPTDVDTGAVHMLRLKLLSAKGDLAEWLLNDHEDNLFLKGWGIANEPVYNQHATVYLLRDDPKAVIRTFYSYMASAFSHSAYEPVEHRWTHGQYFGPPSTDGAWFELYRNMLIHESDEDVLQLATATPRHWLADGKKIQVDNAPTYYGNISFTIESHATSGKILATVQMPSRKQPKELIVRLRHPGEKALRSVSVNGREWREFDPRKEWIRIPSPQERQYSIVAAY